MPRPGIEPDTFRSSVMTLSQLSYRGLFYLRISKYNQISFTHSEHIDDEEQRKADI